MPQRPREIVRPTDLPAAAALLSRTDVSVAPITVAPRPAALAESQSEILVDLGRLGLGTLTADEKLISLGAQMSLQALVESAVIRAHAGGLLAEAARLAAPLTLRHAATVGAAWAAAAGPPEVKLALLALDATPQHDDNGTPALLTHLLLPVLPPRGLGAALERVARAPRDEAIVAVAVRLSVDAGAARGVRLALAGAHPTPRRLEAAESLLEGQAVTAPVLEQLTAAVSAAAEPVADLRAGLDYRRAMAGVLAARAVVNAWKKAAA